jgi:hypothetical protein
VFSVTNESVKSALNYAHRKPWRERIENACHEAYQHPRQAFRDTTKNLIEQAVLLPTNLTGIATELVFLPLDFTQWFAQLFMGFTFFEGLIYYEKYTNVEYFEGIEFYFINAAMKPCIILERNIITSLQAITQEISTVATSAYPYYYYVSQLALQTFGAWFPPEMIVTTKSIHGIFTLCPATYQFYMDDYLQLKQLLLSKPETHENIRAMLAERALEDTEKNRDKMLRTLIVMKKNDFQKQLLAQHRSLMLFMLKTDLPTSILVLTRALLGMYLGYGLALQLEDKMDLAVAEGLLMPSGFLSLGKLLYEAELERLVYYQLLMKETNYVNVAKPYKTDWVAHVLNFCGNFMNAVSSVGTLQLLIANDSPEVTVVITMLLIERMLNSISFNKPRIKASVRAQYETLPSPSECCSVLFKKNNRISAAVGLRFDPSAQPAHLNM